MKQLWSDAGINWIWYYEVEVEDNMVSFLNLRSYRIHKYEGAEHPKADADIQTQTDSQVWLTDGRMFYVV